MTTAVAAPGEAGRRRPAPGGGGTSRALTEAGERGRTVLADRVVEKVAARAATEVTGTADLDRRLTEYLTDRLPGRRSATARAAATISGRLVQLRLTVAVDYPTPIVAVTREVRRHVAATVQRLCDVDVRDVDVVVARLRRADTARRVL